MEKVLLYILVEHPYLKHHPRYLITKVSATSSNPATIGVSNTLTFSAHVNLNLERSHLVATRDDVEPIVSAK